MQYFISPVASGARQSVPRRLGIFIGNLLRREPIAIFGDGDQTRDFIHVSDSVDAWASALKNPDAYGKSKNLGSGLSINFLADAVLAAFDRTRKNYPVQYATSRSGEQRHVQADFTGAQHLLGWGPRKSFEVGLDCKLVCGLQ